MGWIGNKGMLYWFLWENPWLQRHAAAQKLDGRHDHEDSSYDRFMEFVDILEILENTVV